MIRPELPVIVMTAFGSIELAVSTAEAGELGDDGGAHGWSFALEDGLVHGTRAGAPRCCSASSSLMTGST